MADNADMKGRLGQSVNVATDEVAGAHVQIMKPAFGPDGAAQTVDPDHPFPVVDQAAVAALVSILAKLVPTMATLAEHVTGGASVWQAGWAVENPTADYSTGGALSSVHAGCVPQRRLGANGQTCLAVSVAPWAAGQNVRIRRLGTWTGPLRAEVSFSIAARQRQVSHFLGLTADGEAAEAAPGQVIVGASISQTSTTATVSMPVGVQFAGRIGGQVHVACPGDHRLSYQFAVVSLVSADRSAFSFTVADMTTIPSLAAGPQACSVTLWDPLFSAGSGALWQFKDTTTTNAATVNRAGGGSPQVSGSVVGSHAVTVGTTGPFVIGGNGDADVRASTRYGFELNADSLRFMDGTADSPVRMTTRIERTDAVPLTSSAFTLSSRIVTGADVARPVAKAVRMQRVGSVVTVEHDGGWDFSQGVQSVAVRGARDQALFPNGVVATATYIDANHFSLPWSGTATGYVYAGGVVNLLVGGVEPGAVQTTVVASATKNADGTATIIGASSWTQGAGGVNASDHVELVGFLDVGGNALGLDGSWEVAAVSGTALVVRRLVDWTGASVSPVVGAAASVNCGGVVYVRPMQRIHDVKAVSWSESVSRLLGQGTDSIRHSMPVNPAAGTTWTTAEGALLAPSTLDVVTVASTNPTVVKSTAGTLYAFTAYNGTATAAYGRLYNKATAPTVGTDTTVCFLYVPPNSAASFPDLGRLGRRFSSGIAFAATGGPSATDATSSVAGAVFSVVYT